jgi:predicted DNA-binding transcriptional regulator AlpA
VAALPPGSSLTLPREALLEALDGNGDAPKPEAETLLTAGQVAARLGTSERWVYDHADQLGAKRLSRRCVRFPEAAVARYLARRHVGR